MSYKSAAATRRVNPSLVAFKPRQVLLVQSDMGCGRGSEGNEKTEAVSFKPERKVLLLRSIAQYLERSGFHKTLKKFQSEAGVAENDVVGTNIGLEQIFSKYLETSDHVANCEGFENGRNEKSKTKKIETNSESKLTVKEGIEASKEVADNSVPDECENERKIKKKKKKKSESHSKLVCDSVEDQPLESVSMVTKENFKGTSADEKQVIDRDVMEKPKNKKKKSKSKSEMPNDNAEGFKKRKSEGLDIKGENVNGVCSNEVALDSDAEKTKSKKKKENKKASDEGEDDTVSKRRKRSHGDEDEGSDPHEYESGKAKRGKKAENKDALKKPEPSSGTENHTIVNGGRTPEKQSLVQTNGGLDKVGGNANSQNSTAKKQQNSSKEAKKPFQRVNAEEVVFTDGRLQDNSYWAKDGADTGYGAKAQEILGQVRGRDFRHEKTKKKRGSYRGGQIDLHSHSIKFDYSDEE